MFKYKLEWVNDDTYIKEVIEGIIAGEDYVEAMKNLVLWYGTNIIDILSLYELNGCLEKEEIIEIFTEEG